MAAAASIGEQRLLLHNVSWETYERLLAESVDNCGTRFTYDEGELEIMVVSVAHEGPNRALAALVDVTAYELGLDFFRAGSTTFKRKDLAKGFEPDSCYYFEHAARMRRKLEIDLSRDPAPELVIEVDITHSSLNRFPIFAAVGVKEVWRYDGEQVQFHTLDSGAYRTIEASVVLPPMTASQATVFVERNSSDTAPAWERAVRKWIRKR